jgi:hypothetical protein
MQKLTWKLQHSLSYLQVLVAIHNDDSLETFGEAMNSINVDKWIEVIQDEYNSLLINKTWTFTKYLKEDTQ